MRDPGSAQQHQQGSDRESGRGDGTMHLATAHEVRNAVCRIVRKEPEREPISPCLAFPVCIPIRCRYGDGERYGEPAIAKKSESHRT